MRWDVAFIVAVAHYLFYFYLYFYFYRSAFLQPYMHVSLLLIVLV